MDYFDHLKSRCGWKVDLMKTTRSRDDGLRDVIVVTAVHLVYYDYFHTRVVLLSELPKWYLKTRNNLQFNQYDKLFICYLPYHTNLAY